MEAFIYFFEPLGSGLDELEDALDAALQDQGEFTGTGTGNSGSNIDIEITNEDLGVEAVLVMIKTALAPLHVPASTKIEIDGKTYEL